MKWLNLDDAVLVNLQQVTSIEVMPSDEEDEDEEGLLQIALSETASGVDLAVAHFSSFEAAQTEFAHIKEWLGNDESVHTVSAPAWVMRSVHDDEHDELDEDEYDEDDYEDDDYDEEDDDE